ncbi:LysR family transcriptional regulator [Burkholderia ubonensis]|uniref:LysR family transcriptional regulator n=1 Tax=Burkholderia ubonensis TaxID=101571 RepID=UPI00075BF104|nr:LysR family transcriptional regulator [Burkholderia ubonensis]KWB77686.1 LysR family transcriptional regulator [Burkholderia ubonensis]
MNFTHLAAFFAVVETGSVTAASERSHVSQPALTREIRELEERLGVALFDRLPRGMQPTEAGQLLADYAAQIFSLANAAEAAIGEFAGLTRGQLGIGSSRTIGAYLLPRVLNEFRTRFPSITVDLRISNSEKIESAVLANDRQIGMIEGPYDTAAFDAVVIGQDTLIPVASPTHPLARKRQITPDTIGQADLVMRESGSGTRTVVEQAYAKRGLTLSPKLCVGSSEAIKQLVRLGNAIAWVSRFTVAEELSSGALVQLSVKDMPIERSLSMIWRKGRSLSPSARAFRALVTEFYVRGA